MERTFFCYDQNETINYSRRRKRISSTFFSLIMRRDKKKKMVERNQSHSTIIQTLLAHQAGYTNLHTISTLQPKKWCLGDSMLFVKPLAAGEFAHLAFQLNEFNHALASELQQSHLC
jgi:hypothetical protein